jgi:hypothetical protein
VDLDDAAASKLSLPRLADYVPLPRDKFIKSAQIDQAGSAAIVTNGRTKIQAFRSNGFITRIEQGDFKSGKSSYAIYRSPMAVAPQLSVAEGIFEAQFVNERVSSFRIVAVEKFLANPQITYDDFYFPIHRGDVVVDRRQNGKLVVKANETVNALEFNAKEARP